MRTAKKTVPTLDLFRLAAVLLVVMNHTSPLADVSAMADFWLTRVLARVAVPFFLMTTGYFLSRNHWAGVGRQLKKLCLLYGVCILLYLPVNLYAGSFTGPADVLRKLLVDGTFYHLWYFPATILGIVIARWLSRLGLRVALPVAALLYLIGLGGDSYYGLVSQIPLLRTLYDGIFTLCGYTRNGLFFAPLFLLLGAAGRRWNQKLSLAGFFLSLAAMSAEGLWLHRMDVQRHDSMYLALPLCIPQGLHPAHRGAHPVQYHQRDRDPHFDGVPSLRQYRFRYRHQHPYLCRAGSRQPCAVRAVARRRGGSPFPDPIPFGRHSRRVLALLRLVLQLYAGIHLLHAHHDVYRGSRRSGLTGST